MQRRDFQLFLDFMFREEGDDRRAAWTPRLSNGCQNYARREKADGRHRWNDRTVNRVAVYSM